MTVNVTTRNGGSAPAGPSSTRLYLSRDGVVDGADVTLGTLAVGSVSPGTGVTTSASVRVPGGTAPGAYSILARADATGAVAEASEANNTTALAVTVATAPVAGACQACDLVVDTLAAPRTAAPGTSFTASATARNRGAGAAPGTTLRFHLSAHRRSEVGAVELGTVPVPGVAAGATATVSRTLSVPAGTTAGKYHLVATVDAGGAASETEEGNNTRSRAVTIK
jgi:subtilase family serine protease